MNGQDTCRCFQARKHRRLHQRIGRTFSHLSTHCGPIIVRKTNDVSRVGLGSASLMGLPVTHRTRTSIVLMTSVSQKNIFTDTCNSITLRAPRSHGHVGKVVIGGFHNSLHLFRSNIGVVRRVYNVPILKIVPCCRSVCVRRRSSMRLSLGRQGTIRKGIGITIILLHRLSGFASFGVLRRSRQMGLCCAGGMSSLVGTSVVLLPNDGDAVSSLCRLHHGKITRTVLRTHHGKTAIVKVYNKCRVVKRHVTSPSKIRKDVDRVPKLKLLPARAIVRKRGIAHRMHFTFLSSRRPAYAKCRVRVKHASTMRKRALAPLMHLRGKRASNYIISQGYTNSCVRNVLSGPRIVR